MKIVLKHGPGVVSGISTNKAYKGESVKLYDNDILRDEIELNRAYPWLKTDTGLLPGLELDPPTFFKTSIILACADGVDVEVAYE